MKHFKYFLNILCFLVKNTYKTPFGAENYENI